MNNLATNIEDLLEILSGLKGKNHIEVNSSDQTIMFSIARQSFKGTALTDRQQNLMKEKLLTYRDQFLDLDIDFDYAINNLRQPLREIDRSKYIKIVNTQEAFKNTPYESYKEEWLWIKIRFPFSKKTISQLESVAHKYKKFYTHPAKSHTHYFVLKEPIVFDLLEIFNNKDFSIDKNLLEYYYKIREIKKSPENHISSYTNGNLENIDSSLYDVIKEQTSLEEIKIIDRHRRYGLLVDATSKDNSLVSNIAYRESTDFYCDPKAYNTQQVISAINKLKRYPLLIVLDQNNADEQLYDYWLQLKGIIDSSEQSVLFRQEGQTSFNNMIKEKGLNNWVDKNTKIVYISSNKLPKVLLNCDWNPICAIISQPSLLNRQVNLYIGNNCDLTIFRQAEQSLFRGRSRYYDYM